MVNEPYGVRPDQVQAFCRNCGSAMRHARSVGPYANVPMKCDSDECRSNGTVTKNKYGYVDGTYGAVGLVLYDEDEVDVEPDGSVIVEKEVVDELRERSERYQPSA